MNELDNYKKRQHRIFGEFLHEIKTPLTIIRTHLESEIINETVPLEVRQKLVLDVEEVARINHLVNDMKILLGENTKMLQKTFKNESLLSLVMDVVESLGPLASLKKQKISLVSQENCTVLMDEYKLKQLFFNLISNAIKYSKNNSQINVLFFIEKDFISVEVKDEGMGISLQNQTKVFDAFYRVDEHAQEGNGLGLAVSNAIALMHNAKISLKSKIGKGSRFRVKFKRDL